MKIKTILKKSKRGDILKIKAGDGARTRDIQLGKLTPDMPDIKFYNKLICFLILKKYTNGTQDITSLFRLVFLHKPHLLFIRLGGVFSFLTILFRNCNCHIFPFFDFCFQGGKNNSEEGSNPNNNVITIK